MLPPSSQESTFAFSFAISFASFFSCIALSNSFCAASLALYEILCISSNAICPNRFASSCCSSTFFLSKILPSSFSAFWVSLLSPLRSWFGLLLISIVPSAIADFVVESASSLEVTPILGVIPLSLSFAFGFVFTLIPLLLDSYSGLATLFWTIFQRSDCLNSTGLLYPKLP